ncbi:sulfite oxidase [Lutimaribacter saemankumensis]|uniref:DMSO/TMAO reductase YedYZ, molybdopterin-dependent catalytic subunit n=1 Tax=Lutimaribacter saemankumensis TaxID=490829 RepID=A0A1G8GD56_9RHOB|nr:sulfite oxidase [Lutimaribacter saemankumensis]SDH92270.1 DMSO/TMAO reductase YedYZ, molybdopterin-dependent catalytic subunit [Lutimaribacter saemankumensis]
MKHDESNANEELPQDMKRRGFLGISGLGLAGGVLGVGLPLQMTATRSLAQGGALDGKDGLDLLNDRPVNAQTPAHLLDDAITPKARHFVRNNGIVPDDTSAEGWMLTVDGLVDQPMKMSIDDLRDQFEVVTMALTLECGGNGRGFFDPPASGNQWTYGAVACSEWTGVMLRDVLEAAGVQDSVVYTGHYGADAHLSGDPEKSPLSRGLPIEKAMTDNVLIAFEMNGEPLHRLNGAPLRLVVPGWPGSCSQKWLTRIELLDHKHDGTKMAAPSYSVPSYPVAPGTDVPLEDFETIHAMPVKSLITHPQDGADVGSEFEVRGHAWAGDRTVQKMEVSSDYGESWQRAELDDPVNAGAWQNWRTTVSLPQSGYFEIWARATDSEGVMQPFAIKWNPKGYLNNSFHKVAVQAKVA